MFGSQIFRIFMLLSAFFLFSAVDTSAAETPAQTPPPWKILKREDIAKVWSGNPVSFAFEQEDQFLFIAFYDASDKKMVLGQKNLETDSAWTFKKLETAIGWDSHNYIRLAFDSEKYLHVSGNMHAIPLIYFRASKPLDIQSVEPLHRMLAKNTSREEKLAAREARCTYPHFMKNAAGELIFTYRDGGSGNGSQIWNIYDVKTREWRRLLDKPMFDGEGECNAYYYGPTMGPDGFYHLTWVWRDTPDCATNHDLSYARSRDLKTWEKSDGTPQLLPITRSNSEVVAPLKNGQGLLNPLVKLGFDTKGQVVLSYTRYDEKMNNQLMQARLEKDGWKYYQTSDWTHSWVFSGGGCIPTELSFSPVSCMDGEIVQHWSRLHETSGKFVLDPETLKPVRRAKPESALPRECTRCENPQANQSCKRSGLRDKRNPERMYLFAWETLPVNRDRPHNVVPVPSTLRMFVLER